MRSYKLIQKKYETHKALSMDATLKLFMEPERLLALYESLFSLLKAFMGLRKNIFHDID